MKKSMKGALVVTSISPPNEVLKDLAKGSNESGIPFYLIGDTKSPDNFHLENCNYLSVTEQNALPFRFATLASTKSYARKNIGYLLAMRDGCDWISETDDDNFPRPDFWLPRGRVMEGTVVRERGWVNAYAYFSDRFIYPRGFPLEQLKPSDDTQIPVDTPTSGLAVIQQGLADENPDVDAIYRLVHKLPLDFKIRDPLFLGSNCWCPFNSQNTTFFREVFPLMYLPTHCSFRMTDIWRSFVAQRILWTCEWEVAFHSATVWQVRNEHDLLKDFVDEIPGYINNSRICNALATLDLPNGIENLADNMIKCYESMIELGVVKSDEMPLLMAWLDDIKDMGGAGI